MIRLWIRRYRSILTAILAIYFPLILLYKFYDTIIGAKPIINCNTDEKHKENMISALDATHNILDGQKIQYFLCYDSLWALLTFEGLAPWHEKITLCALDASFRSIDELYLRRLFNNQKLELDYQAYEGYYIVYKENKVVLEMYVFDSSMSKNEFKRVGVKRRLLPEGTDSLHMFPAELVSAPLSRSVFANISVPIPREGIEIMKYLSKDSWWIVKKPKGC